MSSKSKTICNTIICRGLGGLEELRIINVKSAEVIIAISHGQDYISLTDMLKANVERVMHRLQKLPNIVAGFFGAATCARLNTFFSDFFIGIAHEICS